MKNKSLKNLEIKRIVGDTPFMSFEQANLLTEFIEVNKQYIYRFLMAPEKPGAFLYKII